jgi:hypothetical protein
VNDGAGAAEREPRFGKLGPRDEASSSTRDCARCTHREEFNRAVAPHVRAPFRRAHSLTATRRSRCGGERVGARRTVAHKAGSRAAPRYLDVWTLGVLFKLCAGTGAPLTRRRAACTRAVSPCPFIDSDAALQVRQRARRRGAHCSAQGGFPRGAALSRRADPRNVIVCAWTGAPPTRRMCARRFAAPIH